MNTLVSFSDSLGAPIGYGTTPCASWPHLLQVQLVSLGCKVQVRNYGVGSQTSGFDGSSINAGHILDRAPLMFKWEVPWGVILQCGVNDGSPWTYTQGNQEAFFLIAKHGAVGSVVGQASLPRGLLPGTRYLVRQDTSTTGGLALPTGAPGTARIGGTLTGEPSIWECRYATTGESGWGRVAVTATPATKVTRLIGVNMHHMNYTDETYRDFSDAVTPANSTEYAPYSQASGLRSKQAAAAAAQGAKLANLYDFQHQLILSGAATQGSAAWLYSQYSLGTSLHLNDLGHSHAAQCVLATILAQSGWLDELKRG